MPVPHVSILIPARNGAAALGRTLKDSQEARHVLGSIEDTRS
jgi:hypothetical protein